MSNWLLSKNLIWVVALLSVSLICSAAVTQENCGPNSDLIRNIPEDLFKYGVNHHCLQINNFYEDRESVRNPPYVFGLMTKKPDVQQGKDGKPIWFQDYSAAFWCKRPGKSEDEYTLLFDFDGGTLGMGSCPASIENQDYIGGLSVIELSNDSLENYFDAITKEKVKEAGIESANGPAIYNEYDGTGFVYYCYKEHWLIKPID